MCSSDLVDSRLGLTDLDKQLLQFVQRRVASGEVRLLVLLTKADKLNRTEAQQSLRKAQEELAPLVTEEADVGIALFSALNGQGVADAALAIRGWVPPRPAAAPGAASSADSAADSAAPAAPAEPEAGSDPAA